MAKNARGVRVVDDGHLRIASSLAEHSAMFPGHPADQPLTLSPCQGHRKPRCVSRSLARRQHNLGNPAPHEAAEVEPCLTCELLELKVSELGQRLVLCELARRQTAQDISHRLASTSRMRCQCVPAQ